MKISLNKFTKNAKLIKKNDSYEVYDLLFGEIFLSMTILHSDKFTTGHFHNETEEFYFFIKGKGEIILDDTKEDITREDIVLVPKGTFHQVHNKGKVDLIFLCYGEQYRGRGKDAQS